MDAYIVDANNIWVDFTKRLNTDKQFSSLSRENQLDFYQKQNIKFATAFPIVLRYMIQHRRYKKKAFIKFIKNIKPYHSKADFCTRGADYVKLLCLETTHNVRQAQKVWEITHDALVKECEAMDKMEKQILDRLNTHNKTNSEERREELKTMVERLS